MAPWKPVDFWVFAKHPAVHSGELAGGGSVVVAVGVSDMWQVTGDTQHLTTDTLLKKYIYLMF